MLLLTYLLIFMCNLYLIRHYATMQPEKRDRTATQGATPCQLQFSSIRRLITCATYGLETVTACTDCSILWM